MAGSRGVRCTCGALWVADVLKVACPSCNAAAGSECKRPSGHNVFGLPHVERERAALAAGVLTMCPKGKSKRS